MRRRRPVPYFHDAGLWRNTGHGTIWARGDEIYRSTDSGKTWRPTLAGAVRDKAGVPWISTMTPPWICTVGRGIIYGVPAL